MYLFFKRVPELFIVPPIKKRCNHKVAPLFLLLAELFRGIRIRGAAFGPRLPHGEPSPLRYRKEPLALYFTSS